MKNSFELKATQELGLDNPGFVAESEVAPTPQENGTAKDTSLGSKVEPSDAAAQQGDDAPERPQWANGAEFVMSCISMSVGLGNVWRFPFTAYENGGGAFLIPYIIVLFIIGKPMYYMEMAMGQFSSYGPIKVWNMSPLFKGIGYGQLVATTCVTSYYCSIMALTLFYFIVSFSAQLPWAHCRPEWGPDCFDSNTPINATLSPDGRWQSSSELYYKKHVLQEPDTIHDGIGAPDWRLALCLLGSWFSVFVVIARGVKSTGKAAYFLALFPYAIMITLLIKGCTLEGAGQGILFFITPQWEKLLHANVWYAAVTQAFFSLNVGFGSLITYASYNNFRENIKRDALIVTTLDTFTSLMAGCTIFAILGNLTHEMGGDISDIVKGGNGLAFISYPDAIAKFPAVPQLFAVLFFLMLFVLGLGSCVADCSAIITIIRDQFPKFNHWLLITSVCCIGFLVGLVYVTPVSALQEDWSVVQGGQFILNLVDFYGVGFVVLFLVVFEMIAVHWSYGLNKFCFDLEFMQSRPVFVFWRLCWGLITPVVLAVVLIYFIATMEPLTYTNVYIYPDSAYAAGWVLLACGVVQLPLWAAVTLFNKRRYGFPQMLVQSVRATELWCPKVPKFRHEWTAFRAEKKKESDAMAEVENAVQKFFRKFLGVISPRARAHAYRQTNTDNL